MSKSLSKTVHKMMACAPPAMRLSYLVLAIAALADLYFTQNALSQLMDAAKSDAARSWIIALSVTGVLVLLTHLGGRNLKLYASERQRSLLVMALVCPAASVFLIAVISFVRFTVAADSVGSASAVAALAAQYRASSGLSGVVDIA